MLTYPGFPEYNSTNPSLPITTEMYLIHLYSLITELLFTTYSLIDTSTLGLFPEIMVSKRVVLVLLVLWISFIVGGPCLRTVQNQYCLTGLLPASTVILPIVITQCHWATPTFHNHYSQDQITKRLLDKCGNTSHPSTSNPVVLGDHT